MVRQCTYRDEAKKPEIFPLIAIQADSLDISVLLFPACSLLLHSNRVFALGGQLMNTNPQAQSWHCGSAQHGSGSVTVPSLMS